VNDVTENELTIDTNLAPLAVNDIFNTPGASIKESLTLNDNDPEGTVLAYKTIPVKAPNQGVLTINIDGTFIYTPNASASGTDEFIYEVCDQGFVAKCSQAKVSINFNNKAPLASNDRYTAVKGTAINGKVSLNDSDP
jgi:hypothetical protein